MFSTMLLIVACRAPDDVSPRPIDTPTPGMASTSTPSSPTTPSIPTTPSTTDDLPPLEVVAAPGVRDVHAVALADATVQWTRLSDGHEVEGSMLPAALVHPGDTWQIVADGKAGTQELDWTVPPPPGGNVLLIVLDDIGIDHVGSYGVGTDPPPTPNMDALADEGMRFLRAYTSPTCSPTRGTVLSGRHARRTGLGWIVDTGQDDGQLPLDTVTIPEALLDARTDEPWSNAALGKWHVAGPAVEDLLTHPNRSGFEHFAGTWGNPSYRAGYGYARWDKNVNGVETEVEGYLTTDLVDDTLDQIAMLPEPWFLYVAFHAAHTPLSAPPEGLVYTPLSDTPSEQELFDATVEALDIELGRLFDSMPPDVRDQTTIVVLGDNGSPEHAVDDPLDPERAKHTAFEQGVRVPLIVAGPHVAPGTEQSALVHATDMYTLVAEIAGVPLSGPDDGLDLALDGTPLDGQAMLPLLADPTRQGRSTVYAEAFFPNGPGPYSKNKRSVRDARWALVRQGDDEHLFDLGADPTLEEGPDLLENGPLELSAEAGTAWLELSIELDDYEAELAFEGR